MSQSNCSGIVSHYLGQGGFWYAAATLTNMTSIQTIPIDTEVYSAGLMTWDLVTNHEATIIVCGYYQINAAWSHENDNASGNQSINGWLEKTPAAGGGFAEILGSRCNTSVSGNAASDATENSTVTVWLETGDLIRMRFNRWAATQPINTRANMCTINFTFVGDT